MVMLAAGMLILLAAALRGGDLRRLSTLTLRSVGLLPVALVVQVAALGPLSASHSVARIGHVASYVLIGVFVLRNRTVPGLLVMAAGAAMNGVTIALNNGTLPASASARVRAGFPVESGANLVNSGIVENPKLGFLGDVFAVPHYLPFANTYSLGDMVLVVGLAVCVATTCCGPAPAAPLGEEEADLPSPRTPADTGRRAARSRSVVAGR